MLFFLILQWKHNPFEKMLRGPESQGVYGSLQCSWRLLLFFLEQRNGSGNHSQRLQIVPEDYEIHFVKKHELHGSKMTMSVRFEWGYIQTYIRTSRNETVSLDYKSKSTNLSTPAFTNIRNNSHWWNFALCYEPSLLIFYTNKVKN